MTEPYEPWHVTKAIPLALIFALIGQTFLAGWWVSGIANDVDRLKANDLRQDAQNDRTTTITNAQAVQLGRIEEITLNTQRAVQQLTQELRDAERGLQP